MSSGSFVPPKEHLGNFIKPNSGEFNGGSLTGLNEKYEALFTSGSALVQAITPVYEKAYYWRSASFFTGVNTNLSSYITPVRDLTNTVLNALDLIQSVLEILDTIVSFGINLLQTLVEGILDLLTSVINLVNPAGSLHLLIIPPKLGNTGVKPDIEVRDSDSQVVKNAKKSEQLRQDFIRYTNELSSRAVSYTHLRAHET